MPPENLSIWWPCPRNPVCNGIGWTPTRKKGWMSLQGRLESDVPNELPRSKETSAVTRSKSVTPIQRPATSIVQASLKGCITSVTRRWTRIMGSSWMFPSLRETAAILHSSCRRWSVSRSYCRYRQRLQIQHTIQILFSTNSAGMGLHFLRHRKKLHQSRKH